MLIFLVPHSGRDERSMFDYRFNDLNENIRSEDLSFCSLGTDGKWRRFGEFSGELVNR